MARIEASQATPIPVLRALRKVSAEIRDARPEAPATHPDLGGTSFHQPHNPLPKFARPA